MWFQPGHNRARFRPYLHRAWFRGAAAWVAGMYLLATLMAAAQPAPVQPDGNFNPGPPAGMAPAPGSPSPAAAARDLVRGEDAETLVTLKFKDAPLDQVLDWISDRTQRTMIKTPGLSTPPITLMARSSLSLQDAFDALESVLSMAGITLLPMGKKFYKVVQTAQVRQDGMPISTTRPEEPFPATDKLVSQIIDLQYITIADAQPVITGFLHGYGKIQTLDRINSLLVTDTAANMQLILEILALIDRPVETRSKMRIFQIVHTEAGKIAGKLNEIIAESQAKQAATTPQVIAPRTQAPPGVMRPPMRPGMPPTSTMPEAGMGGGSEGAGAFIIQGTVKILADDRTNILIIISEEGNYPFFEELIAALDVSVEPEIEVEVVNLQYAQAEDIAGILNDFIGAAKAEKAEAAPGTAPAEGGAAAPTDTAQGEALRDYIARRASERTVQVSETDKAKIGQLSSSTKILPDKRSNSLLLMGRKSDIAALKDVIDKLDVMLPQVIIESVILEINLTDSLSYGIEWLQRSVTVYNEDTKGPRGGVSVRQPVFAFAGAQQSGATPGFQDASELTGRNFPGAQGLVYYTTFFDLNLDAILRMAARDSRARILQTPVIMTTDNVEAKIVVGEQRPVVTSTTRNTSGDNQTSNYEYKNIGISLTVKPHINPDRFVVLDVKQSVDNVGDYQKIDNNEVPVITKREMEAQIAVPSHSTIVLGGLIQTGDRKSRTKLPILGDIPILGALFRSDSKENSRTELLILLTPYVLMTPDEARKETARLKNATRAGDAPWPKDWSKSPLATPDPADVKAAKKADKVRLEQEARERAAARQRLDLEADAAAGATDEDRTGDEADSLHDVPSFGFPDAAIPAEQPEPAPAKPTAKRKKPAETPAAPAPAEEEVIIEPIPVEDPIAEEPDTDPEEAAAPADTATEDVDRLLDTVIGELNQPIPK